MTSSYTEKHILTLDSLNHIRLRAGMYIGRLGNGKHTDDGIYVLLKEVIDNAIDEFIMGHGNHIHITLDKVKQQIVVRDYGRGIPQGKVIDCVSKINTGAKYTEDVFSFSVGLNGVGLKAVNALSSFFAVKTIRKKKSFEALFHQGVLTHTEESSSKEPDGTTITFIPDNTIFDHPVFLEEIIRDKLKNYAYLHRGLTLHYNGEIFSSKNGLRDLLEEKVCNSNLYSPFTYSDQDIEYCFTHSNSSTETYLSFVNGQHTVDGGTHLSAFKEALTRTINDFFNKNFQSSDVREGITGCFSVKVRTPIFESQTKNKLGNTDIKTPIVARVRDSLTKLLHADKERAQILLERIKLNEKTRKNIQFLKQELKDKQKKTLYKIPKLRDCKFHYSDKSLYGESSMIFLTEGESASASILSSRNPLTQAVFSLRGKPMNVFSLEEGQVYKNDELFYLSSALGIKDFHDTTLLRYAKVVLATDADVDGMHIRNLLITFFLKTFRQLVLENRLFILETPLFKVRYKEKTFYCYSEEEKDSTIKTLGKKTSLEITRFKGLGEISPKEFKSFIGPDIRLTPVTLLNPETIDETMNFYMGKNTQKRKRFIIENLIAEL
ncbi:toprim domain-containing protein [Chlamydiifrater phoenicopteri]|uniref:toprim domain-containing protein n=1 Tax=Chlamydiifrater phoenicopteri TaxID=2681469 RepID=UPI001BCC668E|nr:toprim domain-containing protein [Chlamydiifrater phoenicopteri]